MRSNPFLKSKNSDNKLNSRFQFLEPDETDNKPLKKEKKTSSKYDSTDNSFTKPAIRRDNRRDHNNYRNRQPLKQLEPIKEVKIDLTAEYFPVLVSTNTESANITQQSKPYVNFKDIVNTRIEEEFANENNIINPGWVQMSKSKTSNEIIWKYGPPTEYTFKLKKQEKQQNNINYCMNKAIETMKVNWDKYEQEYDEIYGEGAYDEKYSLSPVYGPEYDTESDDEDEGGDQYSYDSYDD